MSKRFLIFTLVLSFIIIGLSGCKKAGSFLKTHKSDYNLTETANRFVNALKDKNYHLISKINQTDIAKKEKMYLLPTLTLSINNPKISSKLISCNPSMALEMPVRVAVYNELNGSTYLSYTNPEYWSLKHNIKDKDCIDLVLLIARDFDSATDAIKKVKE